MSGSFDCWNSDVDAGSEHSPSVDPWWLRTGEVRNSLHPLRRKTAFETSADDGLWHSNAVQLIIRQQPECALLTQENKEKGKQRHSRLCALTIVADIKTGRKPIDPPPIVQMLVDRSCDPQE